MHLLDSLYAIARADGNVSGEEISEIEAIAAEFGLAREARTKL
jgi:tellurite resistance protein